MARSTVRPALVALLASLTDSDDNPLFNAVYDRRPPRVPAEVWPACYVMVPEGENTREGMKMKIDTFGCQLRIAAGGPQLAWPAQPGAGNVYLAPATDPQVTFDTLLDTLITGLIANQAFTQDIPGGNRSIIQLGQKITTRVLEPVKENQTLLLGALIEFPVQELIQGV